MAKQSKPEGWTAKHRYARISPRKVRLVTSLIANRRTGEALDILHFTQKRASVFVLKTLKSAMANADEQEADMGRLVIREARVDAGPVIKRWHPKDRGRAHPINKRTSHIVITVKQV